MRLGRGDDPLDLGRVEREVGGPLALDDRRAGDPGDLGMHLVGRLERGDRPTGARVGEQHRLQHLVGTIGDEHLRGIDAVALGDRTAQFRRGPIRVAMPVDP